MSAAEVYQATAHADHVTGKAVPPQGARPLVSEAGEGSEVVLLEDGSFSLADDPAPVEALPKEVPLRSPARVMRIWFAPWEDSAGDLHMAGHLFTEIEPRRWTVGQKAPEQSLSLQLMEPLSSPPPAKAEPEPARPGPTSSSGRTERPASTSMTESTPPHT